MFSIELASYVTKTNDYFDTFVGLSAKDILDILYLLDKIYLLNYCIDRSIHTTNTVYYF